MSIILGIIQDPSIGQLLSEILSPDHDITLAYDWSEGERIHSQRRHDFTFIDLSILHLKGTEPQSVFDAYFQPFFKAFPTSQIIAITKTADRGGAVGAVKAGVAEFITFPLVRAEVQLVIEKITERLRRSHELEILRDEFWREDTQSLVHSSSPAMDEIIQKVKKVAKTNLSVLITGETGTGKSLLAKLIHLHSPRKACQFISVHCGAIPESLVESELFGHEKGSFTGADKRKLGRFEIAHQGTLFLDEIDSISLPVQVKLLQVLQEGSIRRVGGEQEQSVDIRVIAASNSDLMSLTRHGRFREDLFFRLNVFPIHMPPLRERREDIPYLVGQFISKYNARHGTHLTGADDDVMESMQRYAWPGNIRELEHLVERACVLESGKRLTASSFPLEIIGMGTAEMAGSQATKTLSHAREKATLEAERLYLTALLERHSGRLNTASIEAGITSRQLHNLMKRHGLRKERFKATQAG